MSDLPRWEALADALAADEPLSADESSFVKSFGDPAAVEEREIYDALRQHGEAVAPTAGDAERAAATMAEFTGGQARSPRWGIAVGAVLAVAAAVLLWMRIPSPTHAVDETSGPTVASGVLMLDGVALTSGEALPVDRWVVASARACVEVRRGKACAAAASRFRVRDDGVELSRGELEFTGSGAVIVDEQRVVATDAALVAVSVDDQAYVVASEGTVALEASHDSPLPLGAQVELGGAEPEAATDPIEDDPAPGDDDTAEAPAVAPSPSAPKARPPGEMLSRARQAVADGNVAKALATYAALRRRHPKSAEAHAANVSVGQLELRRGHAKAALRAYSRYLHAPGPLAEEAHWGKIRALHKLGRTTQRDAAIEALRKANPRSLYLKRAAEL
ncbi:MAG: hypothetical protein AAF721_24530 [Myxococcota bacterium]